MNGICYILFVAERQTQTTTMKTTEEDGVVISQHTLVEQEKRISNFDKENPDVDVTEEMREAAVIAHQRKLQS